QVRDRARLTIEDELGAGKILRREDLIVRCEQRHRLIGGAKRAGVATEAGRGIVVGALKLPQSKCQMRAHWRLGGLGHLDLLQDEVEVHAIKANGHGGASCLSSSRSRASSTETAKSG